jgi:alpha-L-fucosidase
MKTLYFILILPLLVIICSVELNAQDQIKSDRFEGTVESLLKYQTPEWFRDAKLGIYLHWGVYSVAEMGAWYGRRIYTEGHKLYKYHLENYGHPSEFGYKEFIPMWKAENFEPDELLTLFKNAGAKYFSPCAVHHDNFDLWDSKHHRWNAVEMGPKKDLIAIWREATLKQGLHFGVTTHLSRSYSWFNMSNQADKKGPYAGVPYDGNNPEYDDLYFKKHDQLGEDAPLNASKEWRETWAKRLKDLIDNYDPEIFYFDCAIPFRGDDMGATGMDVVAHLLNHNLKINNGNQETVMCIKARPQSGVYGKGLLTLDYERDKATGILEDPWQTDDSIGPWAYQKGAKYKSTNEVIDKFIDIVSKNGNLLLNVPIKADGTLDKQTTTLLEEMGNWMEINGEGIYGTRPFYKYGDFNINEPKNQTNSLVYSGRDIRYTIKENFLYAFVLGIPTKKNVVRMGKLTPTNLHVNTIKSVKLLGYNGELEWIQNNHGLSITLPENLGENAICFKIEREKSVL